MDAYFTELEDVFAQGYAMMAIVSSSSFRTHDRRVLALALRLKPQIPQYMLGRVWLNRLWLDPRFKRAVIDWIRRLRYVKLLFSNMIFKIYSNMNNIYRYTVGIYL